MATYEDITTALDDSIRNATADGSITPEVEADAIQAGYDFTEAVRAELSQDMQVLDQRLGQLVGSAGATALAIARGTDLVAWGDSITQTPDFPTKGYAYLLAQRLGGTFTNRGVSGSTIWDGLTSMYANGLLPERDFAATLGFGVNDYRSYQAAAGNAYFVRTVRLFLELCFAGELFAATSPSITYSAGWSASSFNPGTQVRSGNDVLHASGSEAATIVVENADNCTVVLFSSQEPYMSDTVNIYVDGQLYTTVNPKALAPPQGGGSVPVFVRFPRKGSTLVKVENGNASLNTFLDYAIVRRPASQLSAPVLVFSAVSITDALRNGLTQSQWDAMNARMRKAVQQYQTQGYPVRWVDLNVEYDYSQPATADGVHPTPETHRTVLLPNVLAEILIS